MAVLNDYDIRVVKTRGSFTRHSHPEIDEVFLVLKGALTIRLADEDVSLGPGQLFVVPRGVEYQPISAEGAEVVLIEPSTSSTPPERCPVTDPSPVTTITTDTPAPNNADLRAGRRIDDFPADRSSYRQSRSVRGDP